MSPQYLSRLLFSFLLFLFCCANTYAQNNTALKINGYQASFNSNINSWLNENDFSKEENTKIIVLHFNKLLTPSDKQQLEAANIFVKEYLGSNAYSAWISANTSLNNAGNITGIAFFIPEYKIGNSILQKAEKQEDLKILVSFFKEINKSQIQEITAAYGATIVTDKWEQKGFYTVEISSSKLKSFASFYGIKYISEPSQNIPLDLDGKSAEGASILNLPVFSGGAGLRGKDVVVGHGDNCSGIYHIDQSDRTINNNNGNITEHGVLVHGIIGGDGIMDPAGQGIATEGTCISLFFDAVLLLKEELFKGYNATLTNNSYAAIVGDCSYSGTYDILSQNLDEMAFKTTEQLDVFAAGNDGTLTCGGYPSGFYNICGGYQTAKNILTVGSCFRDYRISNSSGRGPVRDGRLKPEICAIGANIFVPVPANNYTFTSGTSLACPQVTGILALLTERYKQLHAGTNPRSDLLKAIAINGASDLGRPGPDYWYGFGVVNAVRSLDIIENNHYQRNTIFAGGTAKSFTVAVPSNTAQLKVLLYYHDPAASTSATTQLVNDIDLSVTEPGGVLHRPLILNPSISAVANDAVEGFDHLNNVEQVSINNPAAGNYTVSVSDFSTPSGVVDYVVVYDFIPAAIKLLYPVANAAVPANKDLYIYWNAPADPVAITKVEFSENGGAGWTTIAGTVPANERFFKWPVPTINSNQCKIKITNGSKVDESGFFIINEQTNLSISAMQCPGSVAVSWTNVPVADKYYMLLKKGAHFQKVDSVNARTLNYIYTGLNVNQDYYMSVMPVIGGVEGFRSKAVTRKPNTGTCAAVPDGDLSVDAIIAPETGRNFTSSALKSATEIKVNIRNQDDFLVSNFSVSYQVNSGVWKTISSLSISANTNILQLIDVYNFSDTIDYEIIVAIKNNDRPDPVKANDTVVKFIHHISNIPLDLSSPFLNDFENFADLTLLKDSVGLSDDGHWDFSNSNDTGRLRTRIPGSKLVKAKRSISLDVNMNATQNVNYFTGTFNLSKYDTSDDEVRFDFEYEMRGMPVLKDSNKVWARGNDLNSWIPVFQYDNTPDTSKLHESGTISLREAFRKNGQNFSTSTQLRFGQYDSTLIVEDNYGGGLTIDNVSVYKIIKDLQLVSVISPQKSNCDITSAPVTIKLKNGSKNPVMGIIAAYAIDGNPFMVESLSAGISGDDSLNFTFAKIISGLTFGYHNISVWVHYPGDDFLKNDTINNFAFYVAPIINSFPYLQNFETDNGFWYSSGKSSSWAYGTPSGRKINNAASGKKVWKTSLAGSYNNNEQSFLNSPCINTSALENPMLSFSTAFDIERCEVNICDRVYLEYSLDNEQTWERLGAKNTGTNWYNGEKDNVWNGSFTRWHVASVLLPKATQLKLRFAMLSDMGTNLEGIAIDDIHIFDLQQTIASVKSAESKHGESSSISGSSWYYFTESNQLIAGMNALGGNFGTVNATIFGHSSLTDIVQRQYYFNKNWVFQSAISAAPKSALRLFITEEEVNKTLLDTACKTCSKPEDIYRAGITQYFAANGKNEDSSLKNNDPNGYKFYTSVSWVPYDNGYYGEFISEGLGEFWINDGGILGTLPLNTEYVNFSAKKINNTEVYLNWNAPIDTQMNKYILERSFDSINYSPVTEVIFQKSITENYNYLDKPDPKDKPVIYYRLFCTAVNEKNFYSKTIGVDWSKADQLLGVYPIPSADGNLTIKWTGAVGSFAHYTIADASGRIISESDLQSTNWLNTHTLNFRHLAKGLYYFKLQIGENRYVEKVIFK